MWAWIVIGAGGGGLLIVVALCILIAIIVIVSVKKSKSKTKTPTFYSVGTSRPKSVKPPKEKLFTEDVSAIGTMEMGTLEIERSKVANSSDAVAAALTTITPSF